MAGQQQQQPALTVQFPTPTSFSAHRARSQSVALGSAPAAITHGKSPSLSVASGRALQAVLNAPAPPSPGPLSARGTDLARQRGLSIAVVKHASAGDNGVLMTPGLPSAGLKSAAWVATPKSAGASQGAPSSARREIILCKYYHTPGLTCTSRPCRFVHDLTLQNSTSPLPSPSLLAMLSPTAVPSPTAGTFAMAQARPRIAEEELTIGETVVVRDELGHDVVGEVYAMSGGGAGLAGRTNKKFKTERCREFAANASCPYGDYCSFLHDEEVPEPKPKEPRLPLAEKRERSAPGFNAWLAKIPKSVYDPKPGAQWSTEDEPESSQDVNDKAALTLKSLDALTVEPAPVELNKPSAWTRGPPASVRPKALDLRKKVSDRAMHSNPTPLSALKSSTVEPPESASSCHGTDSDPATPWDPAVQYERMQNETDDAETAAYKVAHAGMDDHDQTTVSDPPTTSHDSQDFLPTQPAVSDVHSTYAPPSDRSWESYLAPPPVIAGVAIVWTAQGWTVQEASTVTEGLDPALGLGGKKPKMYYRTRPCKFFAEGFCPHGETCSYQHVVSKPPTPSPPSEPELLTPGEGKKSAFAPSEDGSVKKSRPHPKHKTQPCKFFNSAGGCSNGEECAFLHETVVPVHAPLVLRPRPWRTRPCRHFQTSTCHAGDQCHFAHVLDPLFKPSAAHLHRDPLDPNVSPAKPCKYWVKKGDCLFGDKCKFTHPARRRHSEDEHPHMLPSAPVVLWPTSPVKRVSSPIDNDDDDSSDDDVEIEINPTSAMPLSSVGFIA